MVCVVGGLMTENVRTKAKVPKITTVVVRKRMKPIHRTGLMRNGSRGLRTRFFAAGLRLRAAGLPDLFLPDGFAMAQL